MKKKDIFEEYIQCDNCGYCNKLKYVKYSGECHLCKKILDEKAFFKNQMNKKMRLWRGKKFVDWSYYSEKR